MAQRPLARQTWPLATIGVGTATAMRVIAGRDAQRSYETAISRRSLATLNDAPV